MSNYTLPESFLRKNAYFIIVVVLLVLFYSLNNSISLNGKLHRHIDTSLFLNEEHKVAFLKLPAIIHVYDNYCIYCKKDHALFLTMADRSELNIIGLNISKKFEEMIDFAHANKGLYNSNIYPLSAKAVAQFGVDSLPTTIILNENSEVIYYFRGSLTNNLLQDEIIPKYKAANGK